MLPEQPIIDEILKFFSDKLEVKTNAKGFVFATYKADWLEQIGLNSGSPMNQRPLEHLKSYRKLFCLSSTKSGLN